MGAAWALAAIAPMLLAFYLLLGSIFGRISGWTQLGYTYAYYLPFTGTPLRFQSAEFRWLMSYGGCLRFTVTSDGLHLAGPMIFRLGHPPLLFPWSEIAVKPIKKLGVAYLELRFQKEPEYPLRIRPRLADRIRAAGGALAVPEQPALQ